MQNIPPIIPPAGPHGPFPGRGEGAFPSSGNVDLWWNVPTPERVFNAVKRRESSFHFYGGDSMTTVWRSNPVVSGSKEDIFGVPIGPPDSTLTVSRSDIRLQPQVPIDGALGEGVRRKIYAELHSVKMRGEGIEFLAGEPFLRHLIDDLKLGPAAVARIFRRSFGEVVSWDLTGDPERDFPADNHFNVFFCLKYDATSETPAVTLFNKHPVVVVDLGLTQLPPLGRVTIPQFPHDMPELWHVIDPDHPSTDPDAVGTVYAGRGGCCAHSVRGLQAIGDLMPRYLTSAELTADIGDGRKHFALPVRGDVGGPAARSGPRTNRPQFRGVRSKYVDGIFVPNGPTQITRSGVMFPFEDTTHGGVSETIYDAAAIAAKAPGAPAAIQVAPPNDSPGNTAPQEYGIVLGPNAGITFNLAELRRANPDFYLVALVAIIGSNADSAPGAAVRLRVLVDGASVPFADRTFDSPGTGAPISVDLQTARETVTIAATSSQGSANGTFAIFQLRGFGQLATDRLPPYAGAKLPRRPK